MALNIGEKSEIRTAISILVDPKLQEFLDLPKVSRIRTNKFNLLIDGQVCHPCSRLECADDYEVECATGKYSYLQHKDLSGRKPSIHNAFPDQDRHLKFESMEDRDVGEPWQQPNRSKKVELSYAGWMTNKFYKDTPIEFRDAFIEFGVLFSKLVLKHYGKKRGGLCQNLVEILGEEDAIHLVRLALSGIVRKYDEVYGSLRTVIVRFEQDVTKFNSNNEDDVLLLAKHTNLDCPGRKRHRWGRFIEGGRILPWAPQLRVGQNKRLLFSTLCERNGSVRLAPLPQGMLASVHGVLKQYGLKI